MGSAAVALALGLAACGGGSGGGGAGSPTTSTAAATTSSTTETTSGAGSGTRPPQLAGTATEPQGQTVDGIHCSSNEQVAFHIHFHLAVYVNGSPRTIPYGVGIGAPRQVQASSQGPFVIGGSCFYWLHTHAPNGVIHIESPVQRTYTLGDFFDVWGQPLGPGQVGPAQGKVTAYVDGQPRPGSPRSIPLREHEVIQLDVGQPLVPPKPFTFPPGL